MNNIERQLAELDEIYNICDKLASLGSLENDDQELRDFLKARYNVNQDDIKQVHELLKDKKKSKIDNESKIKELQELLKSYCHITGVNPYKDGKLIDLSGIRGRVSNKKSLLKKKQES